jgi:hypothetical protein
MAPTVRFSFRAIKGLSIFDSSNAKSCASSSGVHGRLMGRGPSLIVWPSTLPRQRYLNELFLLGAEDTQAGRE